MSSIARNPHHRFTVFDNPGTSAIALEEFSDEVSGGLEPPPVLIDEIAISTWKSAVPSLQRDGKISGLQQTLLVGYCMALAKALRAEQILASEGSYYTAISMRGTTMRRRHPAVHDAEKSWHAVRQFARQLGISAALKSALEPVSQRRAIFK